MPLTLLLDSMSSQELTDRYQLDVQRMKEAEKARQQAQGRR